ncbi:hypothetical protein PY365_33555 [Roseiarcaceae bacterium H3SJ34-1]|uniref:hypothetical protein n=1 Tax=Terripilifer ovatus TaxID=3032367 RepID=UPI003AB929D3|nr:hypothetical protein [Roseiarcaceae bacterium H3SJ34-1]
MRRTILAAGLIFVVLGLAAMVNGWTIVQVERGWAQLIAGSALLSSGALLMAMSVVVARLEALLSVGVPANSSGYSNYVPADIAADIPAEAAAPPARPVPERPLHEAPAHEFPADEPPLPEAPHVSGALPLETFRPPVPVEPPEGQTAGSAFKRISVGALAGATTAAAGAAFGSTLRPPEAPPFTPPPPPPPPIMPPPLPFDVQASPDSRRAATEFEERLFGATIAKPIEAPMPAVQPEFDVPGLNKPQENTAQTAEREPADVADDEFPDTPPAAPALGSVGDPEFSEELDELRNAPAESETPEAETEPEPEPEPETAAETSPEIDEMAWLDAALRGVEMPKQPEWAPPPPLPPQRSVEPPPPLPPEPAVHESTAPDEGEQPEAASKGNVVRTYESQGVIYSLYDNGSVDAQTPNGLFHFNSVEELREFLAKSA